MKLPHLNFKNACGWIVGVCLVFLAVVALLMPLDVLATPLWRYVVVGIAALAIVALTVQILKQSAEDRDLRAKIDEAISAKGVRPDAPALSVPSAQEKKANAETPLERSDGIDGELYRLVISPRTVSWEVVRDVYKAAGKGEALVDCDALVEMYLVNKSSQNKYVREVRLSAEVDGIQKQFVMQRDMKAKDISDKKYEYGLEVDRDFYADPSALKPLLPESLLTLVPEQATEGWVRFMATDINPDKINKESWRAVVVDSLGNEYPITKISGRPPEGKVGLRRLRG